MINVGFLFIYSLERGKVKELEKQIIFYTTKQDKFKPTAFNYGDTIAIEAFIIDNKHKDTYKTISLFKEPTTWTKTNVGTLIALVLDVEAVGHSFDITKQDAAQLVNHMKKDFDKVIPTPSKIIHSGRGLHFYWDLMPTTDIFKYQTVLKRLQMLTDALIGQYDALAEAKHDPKVNYHSLIRVEGTMNTKAGVEASRLYYNNKRYELDYIIENHITELKDIIGQSSKTQRKTMKHHSKDFKTFKRTYKGYKKGYTAKTLQQAVINDLYKIQELRAYNAMRKQDKVYIVGNEGYRNKMLFYFSVYAKYYYQDTAKAYEAVQAFNESFKPTSLKEDELNKTFTSALRANYATATLKHMAHALELTADEMELMSVIFNDEEKRKRNIKKATISRQKKSIQRLEEKQNNIDHMKELRTQGLTHKQIATIYNLSERTIFRYLK